MSEQRRISASRLNAIDQCTMKYYLREICGLPEKTWARTHAGSAAHSVLEVLSYPKHKAHYDAVMATQSIYASPAVSRLVKLWQSRTKMPDEVVADIDSMCMVALNHSDFLDDGATEHFAPEHEFKMTLSNGVVVKGFIDRLARYDKYFIIKDYKTARNKHTKAEVRDSYQSLTYQLYIWKTFGMLSEVRYYFLRHAPTKRAPDKHVMITPPASPEQLAGFEQYLEHMGKTVNAFGLAEAYSGLCEDTGFCDRVCSYRHPLTYLAIVDESTGSTLSTHMLDNPPNLGHNQRIEQRTHGGCPRYN